MPPDPPRHRTARERASAVNAAAAVARVQARAASFDPDQQCEDRPNVGGPITPAVARQIRQQIEGSRRG